MSNDLKALNRLILQKDYQQRIADLKKIRPTIISKPTEEALAFDFSDSYGTIDFLEPLGSCKLDATLGEKYIKQCIVSGYDESKLKYSALEGVAYLTTHSIVTLSENDYLPANYLTFYFYTKIKSGVDQSSFVKFTDDIIASSNLDYLLDRNFLIDTYSVDNSIIFIDGPFIGGNSTSYSLKLIASLHEKNIIPVFFIKNSESDLIINTSDNLKRRFNSDLHWAYSTLQAGERSNFFKYTDSYNALNTKVFCYIKTFKRTSPIRIEMHSLTHELAQSKITNIMNLIYYLMIANGQLSNIQIRPIAIAEQYARELLKVSNIYEIVSSSVFIPTMNQVRFGE